MAKDNSFSLDMTEFCEATAISDTESVIKETAIELFDAVIKATPVDTGRARSNWFASGQNPATKTTERKDLSGNATSRAMRSKILSLKNRRVFNLTNNLPYAAVLENGGYPSPVKRGTYNKRRGVYEIKSIGGYSKQAPAGMVRVNVARFSRLLAASAAKVRAKRR